MVWLSNSNSNSDSSNNNVDDMATNTRNDRSSGAGGGGGRRHRSSRSILRGKDNIRQQNPDNQGTCISMRMQTNQNNQNRQQKEKSTSTPSTSYSASSSIQPTTVSVDNSHGHSNKGARLRRSYSSSSSASNSSLLYKIEEQKKSSGGHCSSPSILTMPSSSSSMHLPSLLPVSDHSYCGANATADGGYGSTTTCTTRSTNYSSNLSLDSSIGSFLDFSDEEDNDNDNDTSDNSSRSRCSSASSLDENEFNNSLLIETESPNSPNASWSSQHQPKQQQNMNSSRHGLIRRYSEPVLPQQQYPNSDKYNKHQDHHQWYNNMYHTRSSSSCDATTTTPTTATACYPPRWSSSSSSLSSSSISKISPNSIRRLSTAALSTSSISVVDAARKIVCQRRPFPIPPTFSSSCSTSSPITQTKRRTTTFFPNVTFTLQLIVLFVVVGLVFYSRSQAVFTADTLLKLRGEESIGLLKLHQIENHSLHIHELITQRLLRGQPQQEKEEQKTPTTTGDNDNDNDTNNDTNNLEQQYKQLIDMSSELRNHATVTTLQETIQETAIEEIINTYGEGPVKVVLEFDFNTNTNTDTDTDNNNMAATATATRIAIVLWPDTPHAAWTWLEQIQKSIWDGANLEWDTSSTMLQFKPESKTTTNTATQGATRSSTKKVDVNDDDDVGGHLEFIEQHPLSRDDYNDKHHGAWTVGLRETSSSSNLEMFINLSDNQRLYQHEATCVGKIIDGFDTLQRLVESTLIVTSTSPKTNVSVKSVAASHMTNQELEQIYR